MKRTLKAPGSKRLKLQYGRLLSSFAFKFNLRRYSLSQYEDEYRNKQKEALYSMTEYEEAGTLNPKP
jgi:hypothetical protein